MSFSPSLFPPPTSAPQFVLETTIWPAGPRADVGATAEPGAGRPTMSRCAVCHSTDLIRDEVFDRESLQLCACRRCEHRWTFRSPAPRFTPARVPASARRSPPRAGGRRSGGSHAA